MITPVDTVDAALGRLYNAIFRIVTSVAVTYLLLQDNYQLAAIFIGVVILPVMLRLCVKRAIIWTFSKDIQMLNGVPSTEQQDGSRTLVCPDCHGIRAYIHGIRAPEHPHDSCMCQ